MANKCKMCGLCCKLFLINLSEEEYKSGRYKVILKHEMVKEFSEAKKYGLNLLAQKEDGSCIYLQNNSRSIHEWRPKVCRGFFCSSKSKKYEGMREMVERSKLFLKTKNRAKISQR